MKRRIKNLFILIAISLSYQIYAQYEFENYIFDDSPVEIPDEFKNENEVILNKTVKIELLTKKNSSVQYHLIHEKIWVNSDDAIERNNRVYIPFRTDEKLVLNKVRVLLKNGKIIELNKKDIKEEVDEERGIKLNYYAITGLEKGAVIERIFILEENPEIRGKTILIQDELPIVKSSFELIFPKHLGFKYKSYNGLPEALFDEETYKEKKRLLVESNHIKALPDDERYSNWEAHVQMFRYKLDSNYFSGAKNMFNYKEFASNAYENVFVQADKKTTKAIDKFCESLNKKQNKADLIWEIENKLKKTITYNRFYNSNTSIADVFSSKQANELELVRLYVLIMKKMNIETEIVFTSKRFSYFFDNEFESLENLKDVLLYFPDTKQYIEPSSFEYRTPLFNFNYGNNHGLFIKEKEFGGAKMGIGTLGFIEIPDKITHDHMSITVDFTKDIDNPLVHTTIKYGGYSALNFQTIKDFFPEDQYQLILKNISENYTNEGELISIKTENDGTDNLGRKPFVLDIKFNGEELTQRAGNNVLFKVGETIGKQMEFYQEEERKLPVEIYYPHYYTRIITLILPEGYIVKNPDNFVMNFTTEQEGQTVALFDSKYTLNGNTLTVSNEEYYTTINYPLSIFNEYKAVINAAADFNKIVVILEKNK